MRNNEQQHQQPYQPYQQVPQGYYSGAPPNQYFQGGPPPNQQPYQPYQQQVPQGFVNPQTQGVQGSQQQPPGFNQQAPPQGPPGISTQPQLSPNSSPQHGLTSPQQANRKQQQPQSQQQVKPQSSIPHGVNIPARTLSAPPSLEEQQQHSQQAQLLQQQQIPNNNNIKQNIGSYAPEKRIYVQHQQIPQLPYQGKQVPYQGVPMYYQQGPHQNSPMIVQQPTKKPLDIVDPATNERVIITSPKPTAVTTPTAAEKVEKKREDWKKKGEEDFNLPTSHQQIPQLPYQGKKVPYQGAPMYYQQGPHQNSPMIVQQPTKKPLDIVDPATNERVIITSPKPTAVTTPTAAEIVEKKREDWKKKEEDFNLPTSTSISSVLRNSGDKRAYTKELMTSLKPESMKEPSGPLKDSKNQIEANSNQSNIQLNKSGNKIGQQGGKGPMGMNQNPNYPPQMNMKYPAKNSPQNQQGGGNQYNNKYALGFPQYQQQQLQQQYITNKQPEKQCIEDEIKQEKIKLKIQEKEEREVEKSKKTLVTIGSFRYNNNSNNIIGKGSNGTLVFRGIWNNSFEIAIKKMLKNFDYQISKEVKALIETTNKHSPNNIVRYMHQEEDKDFIYLGLTLCEASLQSLFDSNQFGLFLNSIDSNNNNNYNNNNNEKLIKLVNGMVEGVAFLHSINVVHGDLNPRNILIKDGNLIISDFGLSRVNVNSSFDYTHAPSGHDGYHPNEVLNNTRKTKSVDIFSLGCLIYYILSRGNHPFGSDRNSRSLNIRSNKYNLFHLESGDPIATNLIDNMISYEEAYRPTIDQVKLHPLWWNIGKKIDFIESSLNLFKDPLSSQFGPILSIKSVIFKWGTLISQSLITCMSFKGNVDKYNYNCLFDLFRFIRNTLQHYSQIKREVEIQKNNFVDSKHIINILSSKESVFKYYELQIPSLIIQLYLPFKQHYQIISSNHLKAFY